MAKMKVYELAKELNCDSKTVIQYLSRIGCEVKNHMSVVEENFAQRVREKVAAGGVKKDSESKSKSKGKGSDSQPSAGFVPRIVRIPKATAVAEETLEVEKEVIVPKEKEEKDEIIVPVLEQTATEQTATEQTATEQTATLEEKKEHLIKKDEKEEKAISMNKEISNNENATEKKEAPQNNTSSEKPRPTTVDNKPVTAKNIAPSTPREKNN